MAPTDGTRDLPFDIAAVILLVSLTNFFVLVPVVSKTPLRIFFGFLFALFLPGYAFVSILFPETNEVSIENDGQRSGVETDTDSVQRGASWSTGTIDLTGRLVLSVISSVAIVLLMGLALSHTPWGFRTVPVLVAVSVFTLLCSGLAVSRRLEVAPERRFRVSYEEWPGVVTEIHDRGHEIAHHTYSHQHPRHMTDAEERAEFEETIAVFEDLLGERPSGYRGGHSPQTLAVAVENGLSYDASLMDDDLPYLLPEDDLVEIPNDFLLDDFVFWGFNMHPTFAAQSGITPTEPVFETWRAEFDALYRRGRQFVLTMHPQITGRASRIDALDDLLAHVTGTGDTWVATCREVAQHWREHYDG